MIEVRLFGDLYKRTTAPETSPGVAIELSDAECQTVGQVVRQVGIAPEAVGNVFLNGCLVPRSAYPIALGYPLAAKRIVTEEEYWAMPVRVGDRVGIFPRNMSVVVV